MKRDASPRERGMCAQERARRQTTRSCDVGEMWSGVCHARGSKLGALDSVRGCGRRSSALYESRESCSRMCGGDWGEYTRAVRRRISEACLQVRPDWHLSRRLPPTSGHSGPPSFRAWSGSGPSWPAWSPPSPHVASPSSLRMRSSQSCSSAAAFAARRRSWAAPVPRLGWGKGGSRAGSTMASPPASSMALAAALLNASARTTSFGMAGIAAAGPAPSLRWHFGTSVARTLRGSLEALPDLEPRLAARTAKASTTPP